MSCKIYNFDDECYARDAYMYVEITQRRMELAEQKHKQSMNQLNESLKLFKERFSLVSLSVMNVFIYFNLCYWVFFR